MLVAMLWCWGKHNMIKLHYIDETRRIITFELKDWEAVICCADDLTKAPIDLDCLYFEDGAKRGVFNLKTFTIC